MLKKVSIIAAMSTNGVIGLNGGIPWRCSEDLKRFRDITIGHTVIMGRKTFLSIGKALPKRENIVVTSHWLDYVNLWDEETPFQFADSLENAIQFARNQEVFLIGGHGIYKEGLKYASQLILTRICKEVEGDTFFPEYDISEWINEGSSYNYDDVGKFVYAFNTYRRKHGIEWT